MCETYVMANGHDLDMQNKSANMWVDSLSTHIAQENILR